MIEAKECRQCGYKKPISEFYKKGARFDSKCKECVLLRNRKYAERNREKIYAQQKKYRDRNKQKITGRNKAYGDANRERLNEYARQYRVQHADRLAREKRERYAQNPQKYRDISAQWTKRNPHVHAENNMRYYASKKDAVPVWADIDRIQKIYEACRKISARTGIAHHVDHIIPLRSDLVCGLHTHDNLAIIPAKMNISKSNRTWPGKFNV
jgi:hypothetical protein